MQTTASSQNNLVKAIASARLNGRQIEQVDPEWTVLSEQEAYQAMLAVAQELGWPTLGWKIAGTNTGMQHQLRTHGPVFGRTFKRFHAYAPARLTHAQLLDPIAESEFFFRVGTTLAPRDRAYQMEEVALAIEAVFIGIEVAECRFSRHHLPSQNVLIADGFASGCYVQGQELPDWQTRMRDPIAVSLSRNGDIRASGSSRDVMGHPLEALRWLTNRLSDMGLPLEQGALVSTGSCTGMVRARAGDQIEAEFDGIGTVTIDFV